MVPPELTAKHTDQTIAPMAKPQDLGRKVKMEK